MDDGGSRLSWLITVAVLILCAMFFAMTETAFASVSKTRLKTLSDRGDTRAKTAREITDNIERAITTILIGTNIVHIAAASVVTVNVTRIWGISYVTLSTLLTTLAVFFFGEMLPKSIARKYNERISLFTASLLRFMMKLFYPLSSVLSFIGNAAASLTKGDPEVSVTEDELYDIIEDMTEAGTLDEEQGELISSALQFQDVEVGGILTSRVDLTALDINSPHEEILKTVKATNHSRLPVYEGTIDHIIGILQIRKYMRTYLQKGDKTDVRSLLEKPYFIYQTAKIDDLLRTMSKQKQNIAVVLDEFGGTLGIVSVEDILEELVGEIWDEEDNAEENFMEIAENTYSVSGDELVTDVLDRLGIDYDEEEEDRIANKRMSEFALEAFPEIPHQGDSFDYGNLHITIQIMKRFRVVRLKVEVRKDEETDGGEKE